jgi:hypothetical protein
MTTAPGPDERRARALLLRALNGPTTTTPPPVPPAPARPDDWWGRLYDEEQGDHAGGKAPGRLRKTTARPAKPAPDETGWEDEADPDESTPQAVRRTRRDPIRRAQAEYAGLQPRIRWAISTGAGAGLGWALGLQHLFSAWITSCGHDTTPGTAVILGLGLLGACSYAAHATRRYWPPLAWACRIPAATALLAVCLYAPGVTS